MECYPYSIVSSWYWYICGNEIFCIGLFGALGFIKSILAILLTVSGLSCNLFFLGTDECPLNSLNKTLVLYQFIHFKTHLDDKISDNSTIKTRKSSSYGQTSCLGPSFIYWGESADTKAGSQSFNAACSSFKCPHLGSLSKPI